MRKLTFITGNESKAKQLSRYLDFPIEHRKINLEEIQSLDLNKIVEHKAREAFKVVKGPVIVEDVSLEFTSLGRLPGPLVKWFLEDIGNDGLCKILSPFKDRSAVARVCFAFYDGKVLKFFEGKRKGKIAKKPKGDKGFGWDPVFIPEGGDKTWAQMDEKELDKTSMRKPALKKMEKFLKEYFE